MIRPSLALVGLSLAFTSLIGLSACSQSTAHPQQLGDCKSAFGCNPALGNATGGGSDDGGGGGTDSSTSGDGGVEGSADASTD